MSVLPHVPVGRRTALSVSRGQPGFTTCEESSMTAVLHHVALTVTDLEASLDWYSDLFGFKELVREDHHGGNGGQGVVLGPEDWSMFIVMNEHPTNAGEPFDPVRTGLDHVGFT